MPKVFSLAAQFCRPQREKTSGTQGGHVADRNRERTAELFQDNRLTDLSLKRNFFLVNTETSRSHFLEDIFKDWSAFSALYQIGRLPDSRSVGYVYDRYTAPEAGKKASTCRFRGDTEINITLISLELIAASHGAI